jgi:DNA-binding transcriptional LysR family regulator
MNYTLHQLKVFATICEHQSITKAANDLHLTQPAVSIQLKKLQDQFEIPLTELVGRKLHITDFGEEIALACKRILREADTIKTTMDHYKGLLTGKIKISVVSTGKYVIPYFLTAFMQKYPGVEISIDVSNKNKVIEGLLKNDSDFSLVSIIPENIEVDQIDLMDNELYLIGSGKFDGQNLGLMDLQNLTLIFREKGSATRSVMESFLKQNEIKISKTMELVSNEAVKQAVNAGIGFSIMPLIGLKNELQNGSLKIFPIKGLPIITKWNLLYSKNKQLTPATRELIHFISLNKEKVVEEFFK